MLRFQNSKTKVAYDKGVKKIKNKSNKDHTQISTAKLSKQNIKIKSRQGVKASRLTLHR